jgi:LysM repeat protein
MSRTAYIIMEGQDYYKTNKKRVWVAGIAVLLLLILISVFSLTKTVTAQPCGERVKLVTSIEVKKGDTLWSIASTYISDEYDNVNDYIKEIKDSNGITSDEIHAGNFIIVPYYADANY